MIGHARCGVVLDGDERYFLFSPLRILPKFRVLSLNLPPTFFADTP